MRLLSLSGRLRELLLFAWAFLATAAVIILVVWLQHVQQSSGGQSLPPPAPASKRNLIFMVSDGMGPASLSLTRSFRQWTQDIPINDTLALDRHFWGTSRTRSSNSLVTDSAAGATAFSCGQKSYNGAISILPGFTPCGTVLEAAKRAGYHTGLVVTTDITDATPACFASHVNYRSQMDEIALHETGEGPLGHVVDLMLGGGRCHFLPNSSQGSCRQDDVHVAGIAQKKGWTYLDDRAGFDSLNAGENVDLPVLGLFASNDIPFELDRRNMADTYPSLSEMATTALRALEKATKDSEKGFFLMIEGSRIDHAGHINDPAAQVREVLEYDKTFQIVLDFLEQSDVEGVVVSTSDHETGGLSTALRKSLSPLPPIPLLSSLLSPPPPPSLLSNITQKNLVICQSTTGIRLPWQMPRPLVNISLTSCASTLFLLPQMTLLKACSLSSSGSTPTCSFHIWASQTPWRQSWSCWHSTPKTRSLSLPRSSVSAHTSAGAPTAIPP